ncbi:unnamed protein product [Trichobilharzia regenti]|nr:unnamed protein product [Trichobilharzia regenti]
MRSVKPAPLRPQFIDVFIHPCLETSSDVFVRRGSVRRPPYDGPYKVTKRSDKFFVIDKKDSEDTVSVDRLKSVYLEGNPISIELSVPHNPRVIEYPLFVEELTSTAKATEPSVEPSKKARSGHISHN